MKIWAIYYEGTGEGRGGSLQISAADVLDACRAFNRWWEGRQVTDRAVEFAPYFGELVSAKVYPWSPYVVDEGGQLVAAKPESTGGLEWKIDGSGAGFTFIAYAEALL